MARASLVSERVRADLENASWIRRMFEAGRALKQKYGASSVFDFSLGNPDVEPPRAFQEELKRLVTNPSPGCHGYMPNAGFEEARRHFARIFSESQGLTTPLTADHVVMTCGAAGALNILFESILDEGEEVIVLAPYFVEYGFYITRHRGKPVVVQTTEDFQLNIAAIEAAITPKTKAILLNSPNNPTGVIYPRQALEQLQAMLARKEAEIGHDILVVSDEPYAKLVYDGAEVPPILQIFPHSSLATSHSKDLSLAGERIGELAFNPLNTGVEELVGAAVFNNRILGFLNAPALMQRAVVGMQHVMAAGLTNYAVRRDLLYRSLTDMGYQMPKPQGAFYLFPKTPGGVDDVEFCEAARERMILVVPGRGFGQERPRHFRISYSGSHEEQIKAALPGFLALARQFGL